MINDILGLNEQEESLVSEEAISLEEMQVLVNNYEYLSEAAKLKTEEDFKKALEDAKKKKFKRSDEVKRYVYMFITMVSSSVAIGLTFITPTIALTLSFISLIYSLVGEPKNKLNDLYDIKNKADKEIRKLNDKKRKCKDSKEVKDIEERIEGLMKISDSCERNIKKVQKQIETHNYDESVNIFNIMDNFINESKSDSCTDCDKKSDNDTEDKSNTEVEEKCNVKHESITGLI